MGRTTIAVTKTLIAAALRFPAGQMIIDIGPSSISGDGSRVDVVVEGPDVPDAGRCDVVVHEERVRYEFKPVAEDAPR